MASKYLAKLNQQERDKLIKQLWNIQNGKCFISEEPIDLEIHKNSLDIDHIIPLKLGGKDERSNFALTFSSANRSKQASDLKLARILERFNKIKKKTKNEEDRSPNLSDILKLEDGEKFKLNFNIDENNIKFSFSEIGKTEIIKTQIYTDKLSKLQYFFAFLPIEYIHHDNIINPRTIGSNLAKLISEFYKGNPQLHISLGWIDIENDSRSKVKIFDGQHKAAAQILLGIRQIPVRIFINPNKEKIIETNFRAGTTLRQVAFDKSIQRHLGNTLYKDRVERFQRETHKQLDDFNFSEKDLINFYKGESREMKRYILDSVRDSIIHNPNNKLKEFVDFGGRAKEKPLSYSTIDKTFFSFFIYKEALETNINYKLEEGLNPRELEKSQILKLMNIIAEELLIGKFDLDIGTYRIENRIQKGELFPMEHVIAYRMLKEEIIYNWLKYIQQIVYQFFIMQGKPIQQDKIFHNEFPNPLWVNIKNFIVNLSELPLWVNNEFSQTIFGGKQNYDFWHQIFSTGVSPQNMEVLSEPINIMEMIKNKG